ncbi:Epimerase domain-containing protein [Trichoderma simmonsii]|uniref:Epimerase domain-containing protein n=1 Tax=Trichoderma simmonsii TaxID=1491479 RepID=A0A8G0PLU5_9HYPO|nr:Epimerase domain-containing protein [Trichoderma simmonsii]
MAAQIVLVTGASGFIAAHVVEAFLKKGYNVRGTVRSEKTAEEVRKTHSKYAEQLSFAIVPNISAANAFDEAVKGVDGIIHTASPFILNATDFEKELLQPAIRGTTSILEAVQKYNPSVSRIVVTSSFASVLDPMQGQRPGYVYKEADWNPITVEQANSNPVMAYLASKTFAERAVFDYVETNKPSFTVATLCPPMVYGPIVHSVSDVKSLNTSSGDINRLIDGSEKDVPDTSFHAFADVRDRKLSQHPILTFLTIANREILQLPKPTSWPLRSQRLLGSDTSLPTLPTATSRFATLSAKSSPSRRI